jgi:hypothetical protein
MRRGTESCCSQEVCLFFFPDLCFIFADGFLCSTGSDGSLVLWKDQTRETQLAETKEKQRMTELKQQMDNLVLKVLFERLFSFFCLLCVMKGRAGGGAYNGVAA